MAESWKYPIRWVGVWKGNGEYAHASAPILTGGSTGYNSLIGVERTAIINRMNSSLITPKVYLNFYNYYAAGSEYNFGMHKEALNKGTNGIPFYVYSGYTWFPPVGWQRLDITNINNTGSGETTFKQALINGYLGIVLFGPVGSKYGEAYGYTSANFQPYIEIEGKWNTPPSKAQITSPVAGQKVQGSFELKANPAIDAQESASELKYQWSVDDGVNRIYYDFGEKGVTNFVVNFDAFAETSRAQVSVRASDSTELGEWSYSDRFTITQNHAPLAPTLFYPVGGVERDRTQTIIFSWLHNDAGDQSRFDLQWRVQGTPTWNLITETTNDQMLAVAGNTFPVGTIEWNVRTYDDFGLVGPYSSTAVFVATAPSGAPLITSPINGSTLNDPRIIVSWSAPDQEEYELQLVENSTVIFTETVTSTIVTREIPYDLENGKTYFVFLRVRATGGLFSPWASIFVITSFTTPLAPVLTFSINSDDGSILLHILNYEGTSGEPVVERNAVYRRPIGFIHARDGVSPDFIKIADNVENNGTYVDYTPASGMEYEYIVRGYAVNGTMADSNPVQAFVTFKHSLLCVASDPAVYVRLIWDPDRSIEYERIMTKLQFNGREYPVAEYSPFARRKYTMSFYFTNKDDLDNFLDFIYPKETLLYRDGRGRRDFVAIESVNVKEKQPRGFTVSFSPERVDYNEEI